jgi:hypothetical protein
MPRFLEEPTLEYDLSVGKYDELIASLAQDIMDTPILVSVKVNVDVVEEFSIN